MRVLRNIFVTSLLAGVLSGCVIVERPHHWHPCYRCY
jgi:hypothetical protein